MRSIRPAAAGNPFRDSARVLGLYVRGAALIFVCQIVLYSIGFALAKAPLWGFLAVMCAALGVIPRIGSLIGISLVLLISALGGADLTHLAMVGGVWVAVQAVEAFWLAPRFIGKPLGLRPMAVVFALLAGSLVFGPLGLLFAVPVLAIGMVWFRYFKGRSRRTPRAVSPTLSVQTYVPPTGGSDPYKGK